MTDFNQEITEDNARLIIKALETQYYIDVDFYECSESDDDYEDCEPEDALSGLDLFEAQIDATGFITGRYASIASVLNELVTEIDNE